MLFMLFSSVLGYLAISIDCKHAEKGSFPHTLSQNYYRNYRSGYFAKGEMKRVSVFDFIKTEA